MFDIGFPELVVISVVALLVIGPEKLPEAVRTASLWIGRMQRSFANIRREIESEIGADEVREQLRNESIMADLETAKSSVSELASEVRGAAESAAAEVKAAGEDSKKIFPK